MRFRNAVRDDEPKDPDPANHPAPRWIHWAFEPLREIQTFKPYEPAKYKDGMHKHWKPDGIWLSNENEPKHTTWSGFVKDLMDHEEENSAQKKFQSKRIQFAYEFSINDENCIKINGVNDHDAFAHAYALPHANYRVVIDWKRVVESYDGIIIPRYLMERRIDESQWYYLWDVGCACVWKKEALVPVSGLDAAAGRKLSEDLGGRKPGVADIQGNVHELHSDAHMETVKSIMRMATA